MTPTPYLVTAYRGEERLPIGCVGEEFAMEMARNSISEGYESATVFKLVGTTYLPIARVYRP